MIEEEAPLAQRALDTHPVTAARRYPAAPLVGVGAVVFDDTGNVLLVQRAKEPGKGTWGLPGGLLDVGEHSTAAVLREVREETGLEVEVGDLLATFEPVYRDGEGNIEYHYVVLDYWARATSTNAAPGDDAAAVAWVDPRDAAALEPYNLMAASARMIALAVVKWETWRAATAE